MATCFMKIFIFFKFQGKFILTFHYSNHHYGLSRDTVEGIARDGLASCIHMEIEVSVFMQFIFNVYESLYIYLGGGYNGQVAYS